MSVLHEVVAFLLKRETLHALIGAAAMAVHGVARSTLDVDILVVDRDLLLEREWRTMKREGIELEIRVGDAMDPLAGVIRLEGPEDESVDVIVGRGAWEPVLLERATTAHYAGVRLPAVDREGLVQLKLYAGGPQDMWDIHQLLMGATDADLKAIDTLISSMPRATRERWTQVKAEIESRI